jgi:hypothetical protein
VPDLARTSRSTRLKDMRPKVSPDINPANTTSNTIITILMKNSVPQHVYSTAIENQQLHVQKLFRIQFPLKGIQIMVKRLLIY